MHSGSCDDPLCIPASALAIYSLIKRPAEHACCWWLVQEYSVENALDKMLAEWAGLCFETLPWRATGCTILRAVDDIQQVNQSSYQHCLHCFKFAAEAVSASEHQGF